MTLVAGVDSSTQSCKVVVRDLAGNIVREGRAPHPPGTAVDPALWWNAMLSAVQAAGGLMDVEAISVGAQQHGMVAMDERGNVLRDALMWNDTSSAPAVVALNDELGADEWVRRTGLPLAVSFTVTKLRWLRDNEPDNAAEAAAVILPHDYLTWRLKGGEPGNLNMDDLTTDRSDASGTAYWSGETEDYCHDLVEVALGHRVHLPRVLGPRESAGVTAEGLPGIPAGIPIGVGGGDNACAALALGLEIGDAVISMGTSGTVYARTDRPVHDFSGVVSSYADASGAHLPLSATLNAARDVDVVARLLGRDHGEIAYLASVASPGCDGLTLLPYFEGERTPNLPDARASLYGMNIANTTPANLARAAVEGMLCSQVVMLNATIDLGVPVERVLIIGGAARSAAVRAILPQIIDKPIFAPEPGEYVAQGAAMQAVAALTGDFPDWEQCGDTIESAEQHPEIMGQHLEVRQRIYGV
ncbi:FGGY family carbohydrate kinase [Actinobaculum sp. 352]|uniref:xylulokinase n=1 Tax=Actinobaculum sp. 352 TaxID=2490946 RepID=UPI000F7E470D|nr:FGGY family carbohydrate kinase [Actinobaculum sp. 352]RTE50429.1 xylulose kinase [Actinobaculum sp. 352]